MSGSFTLQRPSQCIPCFVAPLFEDWPKISSKKQYKISMEIEYLCINGKAAICLMTDGCFAHFDKLTL